VQGHLACKKLVPLFLERFWSGKGGGIKLNGTENRLTQVQLKTATKTEMVVMSRLTWLQRRINVCGIQMRRAVTALAKGPAQRDTSVEIFSTLNCCTAVQNKSY